VGVGGTPRGATEPQVQLAASRVDGAATAVQAAPPPVPLPTAKAPRPQPRVATYQKPWGPSRLVMGQHGMFVHRLLANQPCERGKIVYGSGLWVLPKLLARRIDAVWS
jgi:hypothetical protein